MLLYSVFTKDLVLYNLKVLKYFMILLVKAGTTSGLSGRSDVLSDVLSAVSLSANEDR